MTDLISKYFCYRAHSKRKYHKHKYHYYKKQQNGFSLIEAMIVITITSVLISTAAPSFSSVIDKSKLTTTSSELYHSLYSARQYSISSGKNVHVCALDPISANKCESKRDFNANWSQGWMVFADLNNNNNYDSNDLILKINEKNKDINIVFNQRGRLRFFPDGGARSAGFYICSKNSPNNRHIKLLYSGRVRTSNINKPSQLATCLAAN